MNEHVNFILLGLGNGAVFAALALGLVVTYRSSGVLNFATGALALYAAYTYAFLRRGELLIPIPGFPKTVGIADSLGFAPALAIVLVIQALLGALLYVAIFRPLRNHRPVAKAVASLGVMIFLTALVSLRVGSDQVLVKPIYPTHTYVFGDIRIVGDRLWFAVTIVAIALVLAAVYRFTRFGIATRAAAETEVGALVTGLSPERLALANWAIASVVAGLAGVLIAPLVSLIPGTYTLFIVPALAAAVLGRFTYIMPAVLGGVMVGLLQSETVFLRGRHQWINKWTAAELVPLILVLLVLVVRGRPLPTRGTLIQQTLGRAPRPRSLVVPTVAATAVGVVALFVLQGSYRGGLIVSFITAIIALSLVVVTGYVGQISLAQLTLAGVAGFTLSTFADSWGIPFPIAPILASLVAMVVGVVVGLPALRIRGLLVAVVTLTLAVGVEAVWFRNNAFNGGSGGKPIPVPKLFGLNLGIGSGNDYPRPAFGVLCLVVLVIVAIAVAKLRTSRLGSAMLAVRANERSAAAAGISVVRVKLIGFAIGAFIAGLGGCLLAYKQSTVTFDAYDSFAGLALFSFVFLAGITSVSGGILAGLVAPSGLLVVWIGRVVDVGDWYGIVSGIGVVLAVINNPEGLVGPIHQLLDRRRQRRLEPIASETDAITAPGEPGTRRSATTSRGPDLLSINDLSVRYGGVVAVDEATFAVSQGEIVGLIGPNGAGKTTAMDALCGFVNYTGHVTFEGHPLDGLPPHRRAMAGVGRTFQGIDLYEDLSVEENVVVGQYMAKSADTEQLRAVLDLLGLSRFRERNVRELSQGQRQLISIARALAGQPRLLLLDEPAAGLDTTESAWLAERLHDVRDSGVTILLVDHDMSLVLSLCDTINVLDFGRVVARGNPTEVRNDPVVTEAYLGATHAQRQATS